MPKQTIFDEDGTSYKITKAGDLVRLSSYDGDTTLIEAKNLEEFVGWLSDEADALSARRRNDDALKIAKGEKARG